MSSRLRAPFRRRVRLTLLGVALVVIGLTVAATLGEKTVPELATTTSETPPPVLGMADSWQEVVDELRFLSRIEPKTIGASGAEFGIEDFAAEAASGAYLVLGNPSEATIRLDGNPLMADRVAIGLAQLGVGFSRSVEPDIFGSYGTEITLDPDDIHRLDVPAYSFAALVRLATVVELSGSDEGRLAAVETAEVRELANRVGIETETIDGELWIADVSAISVLAEAPFLDPSNVPFLGIGLELSAATATDVATAEAEALGIGAQFWRLGVTGELPDSIDPEWVGLISESETPIGWTNAVAQAYRIENVDFSPDALRLATRPATEPAVTRLPFTSGMVVSREGFGWGTTTVSIDLPNEAGLWPAVWLLDSQACFAPGICPGFQTDSYHEIDIIETRTQEPDIAHMSVHWGADDRTVSNSATAVVRSLRGKVVIELERRPGLLIWRIDGRVVHVLGGHVAGFQTGPHRSGEMRLIMNTAVGGSFAGHELIGRDGGWWGDAKAPQGFGDPAWSEANLVVNSVAFSPLAS